MRPDFEDPQSRRFTSAAREPLVDIHVVTEQPAEPDLQFKPRRKRLSDVPEQTSTPLPEPRMQRRRLSEVMQSASEEPAPLPQLSVGRPRLSATQAQTAVLEAPENTGQRCMDNTTPASAQRKASAAAESCKDSLQIEQWIGELRTRQSFPVAVAGGLLAAVVGALAWAVVTVATSFQIGWMAVGVGLLIGGVVRVLGRGLDKSFGYLGAGLALFGCLLGNYLTNCMFIAREVEISVTSVITQINPVAIPSLMIATFHPMDLLFYGLAVYEGYRFSFRRITEAQISRAMGNR